MTTAESDGKKNVKTLMSIDVNRFIIYSHGHTTLEKDKAFKIYS